MCWKKTFTLFLCLVGSSLTFASSDRPKDPQSKRNERRRFLASLVLEGSRVQGSQDQRAEQVGHPQPLSHAAAQEAASPNPPPMRRGLRVRKQLAHTAESLQSLIAVKSKSLHLYNKKWGPKERKTFQEILLRCPTAELKAVFLKGLGLDQEFFCHATTDRLANITANLELDPTLLALKNYFALKTGIRVQLLAF